MKLHEAKQLAVVAGVGAMVSVILAAAVVFSYGGDAPGMIVLSVLVVPVVSGTLLALSHILDDRQRG